MMASQGARRSGLVWAIVGAVVLLGGVVAIVIASIGTRVTPDPTRSASSSRSLAPSPSHSAAVDPGAIEKGWIAEPITPDPSTYITAALEAAGTFDTTKSSRDQWLAYLDTWFTPDTRYTKSADQQAAMQRSKLELRQGVVLPESDWESLASEDGRVATTLTGSIIFVPVTEDPSGDMRIGTADVTLKYTRSDGSGGETSYEDHARVSVQVLCGPGSVPTPDSAQRAGDCKVVRYFTQAMEP
ncbi:MAG TPA: hypothetical protein VJR25_15570 [Microbacterium sp.]|uniref:hypothetical protein n=1 Tax=Microbacterium sp. TaxID=51671 RepID=UPI002B47ACC3|nr:hypothetical protein [Microbacterium sp.]HKT58180.1 hypothetical protein [Microbacterium sp.]